MIKCFWCGEEDNRINGQDKILCTKCFELLLKSAADSTCEVPDFNEVEELS